MTRTTHLSTEHTGDTVTTTVTEVDVRTGERRDVNVITQRFECVELAIEDRGHETCLPQRSRSSH